MNFFPKFGKSKFKFTYLFIVILFEISGRENGSWCLSVSELLYQVPHLLQNFQQVVIFSDGNSSVLSSSGILDQIQGNSTFLLEINWKKGQRNFILDKFKEIDEESNTLVFFTADDPQTLFKMITEVSISLSSDDDSDNQVDPSDSIDLESPSQLNYQWISHYFILWPNLVSGEESERSVENFLWNFTLQGIFPLNSDIYCISKLESGSSRSSESNYFSLWEMYSIKDRGFVQRVETDIFKPNFIHEIVRLKWRRRRNFQGVVIKAAAVIDLSYEAEVKFRKYENGSYSKNSLESGYAVSLYRLFRDHLNFTEESIAGLYMFSNVTDGLEPIDVHLRSGRADLAITESGISDDKAEIVHFLHATLANWLEARFSQPSNSKWTFFLSPFNTTVWILIVIHVILMVISMFSCRYIIMYSTSKMSSSKDNIDDKSENFIGEVDFDTYPDTHIVHILSTLYKHVSTLHLDILWALGTLGQQGWYDLPSKTPMKILCIIGSTTGFLLFAAYSGVITSKLSVKEVSEVTFEKLLNLSYDFYLESDFEFPVDRTKYSRNITVKTLWDEQDMVTAIKKILVLNQKSVILSYPEFFSICTVNANISTAVACEKFMTFRVSQTPALCAMAVPKSSPLKEILNIKILFIWERGILPRLLSEYKRKTQLSCRTDSYKLKLQHLSDLYLAFALIVSGIIISVGILFIENLVKVLFKTFYAEFFV